MKGTDVALLVAAIAAVSGLVGVVVGGIVTGYFANRAERIRGENDARLDGAKRTDNRGLARDEFQRRTLLSLQEAAADLTRSVKLIYRRDLHEHDPAGTWRQANVRDEMTDAEMNARQRVMWLIANAADDQVRRAANELVEAAFTAAMSQNPVASAEALATVGTAESRLAARTGELIVASFRAD